MRFSLPFSSLAHFHPVLHRVHGTKIPFSDADQIAMTVPTRFVKMRPQNNDAKAEARECKAENEAEAKELLCGRGQNHEAEAKR